jgi:hypothetical protein
MMIDTVSGNTFPEEIIGRFQSALERLLRNDLHLLQFDVSERAITHKLAEYLQPLFENRHVDCEYNRNGHEPKRVNLPEPDNLTQTRYSPTYPDIIVHLRGTNDYNTLIVEAKKTSDRRQNGEQRDIQKLMAYAQELGYIVGILAIFDTDGSLDTWCKYRTYYGVEWHNESVAGQRA